MTLNTPRNSYKHSSTTVLFVVLFLAALVALAPKQPNATSAAASAQRNNPILIFAIGGEPDGYHMDALASFNGRQFDSPFSEEQKADQKKFGDRYFAAGRKYRLIFGGGEAGSVTVNKWSEGCNSIHSDISITTTAARLGGQVRALATNSSSLGQGASTRRAPSEAERAGVMTLVKKIYSQRRTPANLLSAIKTTNLTATDLEGDGKYEMIGSFTLSASKYQRDLFLIAKSDGYAMRADFVKFQGYRPPPEGFLSSIDFIDQLDVDKNGVGEVFAIQGGFDGYGYLIFKKVAGRWRQVFSGMGDVC